MQRWGSGLVYALVSVVLVVGGLSLALAEGSLSPSQPPPTQASITVPAPSLTSAPPSAVPTNSPLPPSPVAASATSAVQPSATPQVVFASASATTSAPTATTHIRPTATATRRAYATAIPCGPYSGWVRSYTVQAGDTLYHISTLYRTTVPALQTANCLTTTYIFPGENLWVPNVPTVTPGLTLPPNYATATAYPTLPLTLTPLPFTETPGPSPTPTETFNPDP